MEDIAKPLDSKSVRAELTPDVFLRYTNKGHNEIYLVNTHNAPNVMYEIGRGREEAFRAAGGGTGKNLDIDQYDTADFPYEQLVVWNPEDQEIMAGYRLLDCPKAMEPDSDLHLLATSHLFHFTDHFVQDFLPYTYELGRSFVLPKYQGGASKKGVFALDNLWDGLGAIIAQNPKIRYLFGKVTMYPSYNRDARNALLAFLSTYFPDPERLIYPFTPLVSDAELVPWRKKLAGKPFREGYLQLNRFIRSQELNIPPLINSYMNLSETMRTFGTSLNDEFGDVEETGILITIDDIYEPKRERHIATYERDRIYGKPHWKNHSHKS